MSTDTGTVRDQFVHIDADDHFWDEGRPTGDEKNGETAMSSKERTLARRRARDNKSRFRREFEAPGEALREEDDPDVLTTMRS